MKTFFIPQNTYRVPLNLVVTEDRDEVIAYGKKEKLIDEDVNTDKMFHGNGAFYWGKSPEALVWVKSQKDIPSLVHELAHYCFAVLTHRGIPINQETDEAFTYLLGEMTTHSLLAMEHKDIVGADVV